MIRKSFFVISRKRSAKTTPEKKEASLKSYLINDNKSKARYRVKSIPRLFLVLLKCDSLFYSSYQLEHLLNVLFAKGNIAVVYKDARNAHDVVFLPDFFKMVRRSDRKVAKIGTCLFLLVVAVGVAVFWFLL